MTRGVLLILDGAGLRADCPGNAVTAKTMPRLFSLMEEYGHATLAASGPAVGLEPGMVGNSEVGHTVIGAGYVPPTSLQRINQGYQDGSWARHGAWQALAKHRRIHIVGLLSDAGVHAHARTIQQANELARRNCPDAEVIVHLVLDGVDAPAGSAIPLMQPFADSADCDVGLVMGRKWFCDRSGDLAITRQFVDALMDTAALPAFSTERLAEHLGSATEASFPAHAVRAASVAPGEPVLLTSHRADRAQQVARMINAHCPVYAVTDLGEDIAADRVFFPSAPLADGLARTLQRAGVPTTRIAESSKFPHVTRFFNGLNPPMGERAICIPAVPDQMLADCPQMSLATLLAAALEVIESEAAPHALVVNVANLDQIGHLGRYDLAAVAASHVDSALWDIHQACRRHGWELLVTADHGNADQMTDDAGGPFNSHSPHPVPLLAIPAAGGKVAWHTGIGTLAHVAPTFLALLGIEQPALMAEPLVSKTAAPAPESLASAC